MHLSGKRVLITQGSLFTIAGSEVASFELAGYFVAQGAEVIVVSFGFGGEWESAFRSLGGVALYRFDASELDEVLNQRPIDLAWIHHQLIPEVLLRRPSETRFIFHHMSSFLPQEFPVHHRIEAALADAVVFTSPEAMEAQLATGLLDSVDAERLRVLGNPAPDAFYVDQQRAAHDKPRILVVSNHLPAEVSDALQALSDQFEVVLRGSGEGSRKELISTELLATVDAVISIGKTAQYALVGAIPVYCYDHFGGPGWLSPANFEKARALNFSGRGFGDKSSEEIASELTAGFIAARADARALHTQFATEMLISTAMSSVLSKDLGARQDELSEADITSFLLYMEIMNGLTNAIEARTQTVQYLQDKSTLDGARIADLEHRVRDLEATPGIGQARSLFARLRGMKARAVRATS